MLELNQIYNESCLDTMRRMPDGFVDLTVTSPPYDNLRNYNGYEFDFESIAKELFRVTKQGGVVVWVVGDATVNGSETGTSFRQALYFKEIGFNLHDTMIYATKKLPFGHNRYEQCFEYMFVFSKKRPKVFNALTIATKGAGRWNTYNSNGASGQSEINSKHYKKQSVIYQTLDSRIKDNIWFYHSGAGSSSKDRCAYDHPAIFPEQLAKDHILSWSNENDLVYDCFMGSGTTAKAAHLLKRNWIGSEISAEYVEIANKRLEPYLMQNTLF